MAELGRSLNKEPDVISLDPIYLSDVLEDIRQVGRATGAEARAESLTRELQVRIDAVVARTSQAAASPRVLQLEWADPLMCGGPLGGGDGGTGRGNQLLRA